MLMDRYIKMQTLHTATLHALTAADGKGFEVDVLGDQALADGDKSSFDRNMAEAVAGVIEFLLLFVIFCVVVLLLFESTIFDKKITILSIPPPPYNVAFLVDI